MLLSLSYPGIRPPSYKTRGLTLTIVTRLPRTFAVLSVYVSQRKLDSGARCCVVQYERTRRRGALLLRVLRWEVGRDGRHGTRTSEGQGREDRARTEVHQSRWGLARA